VVYPGANLPDANFTFPKNNRKLLSIFVIVACLVGAIAIFAFVETVFIAPAAESATIEEKISAATPTTLPKLSSFIGLTDAEIYASLTADGNTYYEVAQTDGSLNYEVMKIPADLTLVDAAAYYAEGISNLSALHAFELLDGSWDLEIDRETGETIKIHWADFTSTDAEEAVATAATNQGFDVASATGNGVDSSGNTYIEGSFIQNSTTYSWRVSAIELSEIYSVSGLPDTSLYLGIRITS
jgi:hypothetical protein